MYLKKIILLYLFLVYQLMCFSQPGTWTWIRGSNSPGSLGSYGIQGVPSPVNEPPAVYEPAEFQDLQGNFWFFGGMTDGGPTGDLWRYTPANNQWTWIKGTGLTYQAGVFGVKGVPSVNNLPPTLYYGVASWVDLNGDFWMFGGAGPAGFMSDLWKYNILSNTWTWMHGTSFGFQPAIFGTQGVASPVNMPGYRQECNATWVDGNNNLWLFGGWDGSSNLNDLWKYDPTINQWTWVNGNTLPGQPASFGIIGVPNANNDPGARNAYCHWKDLSGKFYLFGGDHFFQQYNDLWSYDPTSNLWTWAGGTNILNHPGSYGTSCISSVSNVPSARTENRCFWTDPNGNFWMYGGRSPNTGYYSDLWVCNPATFEWTFVSGDSTINAMAVYGALGMPSVLNKPGPRMGSVGWISNTGYLYLFGGNKSTGKMNDLWRYEIDPNCPVISSIIPSANLASSDTTFCDKQFIDFFDLSTNSPTSWQWLFPGGSPSSSTQQNPVGIYYNSYGIFDVTLIACNASGCDTLFLPNFINEFQSPPVPVVTWIADTLFSTPAFAYQWYFNSNAISGATDQYYVFQQPGDYFVIVTDSNGCSTPSTIIYTGIDELNSKGGIYVIPNPTDGDFILVGPKVNSMVKIYDVAGRVLYSGKIKSLSEKIHFDAVDGIYFIEIAESNNFIKRKIVLKN